MRTMLMVAVLMSAVELAADDRSVTFDKGTDFAPVSFTEGTLVIDLKAGDSGKLVWHGVSRRPKDSAGKLAEKLPGDAKKLLSEFPPKKK